MALHRLKGAIYSGLQLWRAFSTENTETEKKSMNGAITPFTLILNPGGPLRRLGGANALHAKDIRDCFAPRCAGPRQTKLAGSGFSRALIGACHKSNEKRKAMIIDHIYLPVSDLKRSSEFLQEKMLEPLAHRPCLTSSINCHPRFRNQYRSALVFWLKNGEVAKDLLRRVHRQERGCCQSQLQGGDRRGSYFNQGTEPSARMA